jgi:hypothetical protein
MKGGNLSGDRRATFLLEGGGDLYQLVPNNELRRCTQVPLWGCTLTRPSQWMAVAEKL